MVDFPDHPPRAEDDAGQGDDAGTAHDAQPGTDTGTGVCSANSDCGKGSLCCADQGTLQCVQANAQHCTSCSAGCDSPTAPNCGSRACECAPNTNKACANGQVCDNSGAMPHCVECAGDGDCKDPSKPFCDGGQCVECKSGADLTSSADDVGCSVVSKPICANHTCIGCDDSMPATKCPAPLTCTPGVGCGGCKADVQIVGMNGCTESAPICKAGTTGTSCVPCTQNSDCKYSAGSGYCATGRCSNICDGDSAPSVNGCADATKPFCKPSSTAPGGFDCAACVAADCANGTFCATTGAKAGSCVSCRSDSDCNPAGTKPICDQTSFTCRARTMSDCAAPTPYLNTATGKCVQCLLAEGQCPSGQRCTVSTNTCGECGSPSDCPNAKPSCVAGACTTGCSAIPGFCNAYHTSGYVCSPAGTCVQCVLHTDCAAATPLCEGNVCKRCDQLSDPSTNPDTACALRSPGTKCLKAPPSVAGTCGT